jgi:hypothetical protein
MTTVTNAQNAELLTQEAKSIRKYWGWFLALGTVQIIAGALAVGFVFGATFATVVTLGFLLLIAAGAQMAAALLARVRALGARPVRRHRAHRERRDLVGAGRRRSQRAGTVDRSMTRKTEIRMLNTRAALCSIYVGPLSAAARCRHCTWSISSQTGKAGATSTTV